MLIIIKKLIHQPTRVSGNSSCMLDNIHTNLLLHEENEVPMTDITDHYSIFTIGEDPEPGINRKLRKRRYININNIVTLEKSGIHPHIHTYNYIHIHIPPPSYTIMHTHTCFKYNILTREIHF